jgi:hypothetical protein
MRNRFVFVAFSSPWEETNEKKKHSSIIFSTNFPLSALRTDPILIFKSFLLATLRLFPGSPD